MILVLAIMRLWIDLPLAYVHTIRFDTSSFLFAIQILPSARRREVETNVFLKFQHLANENTVWTTLKPPSTYHQKQPPALHYLPRMWKHPGLEIKKLSRQVDMTEPLLTTQDANSVKDNETKIPFDDTEDIGTESTSIASPGSADSRCSVASSVSSQLPVRYIDNSRISYVPITLTTGNTVHCAPDVLSSCPMILRSIQTDLLEILNILPWSVHALVKRTNIWVNLSYSYGTQDEPHVLRHSTAHHEEGWLVNCARDRPEKSRCIEIYSCFDFERMRLHWNGCGLLLHEFCHLIHQECLGLDHPHVQKLYTEAYKSGRYEEVLRRDWAGRAEDFDMAYAMVDQKEFFAEMSVTFWSTGYGNLDKGNPQILQETSPALLEPTATARVIQKYNLQKNAYDDSNRHGVIAFFGWRKKQPKIRMIDPEWQQAALGRGCRDVKHCNKFYPFTAGQLKHHDPALFREIHNLWNEISMYDDPAQDTSCCFVIAKLFPSIR